RRDDAADFTIAFGDGSVIDVFGFERLVRVKDGNEQGFGRFVRHRSQVWSEVVSLVPQPVTPRAILSVQCRAALRISGQAVYHGVCLDDFLAIRIPGREKFFSPLANLSG